MCGACLDGKITEFPAIQVPAENIVDTNGAGDAFVGGESTAKPTVLYANCLYVSSCAVNYVPCECVSCKGFLAQLIQGGSLAECMKCAHYVGNLVIQRSGCTFPEKFDFTL